MRKSTLVRLLIVAGIPVILILQACKDDSYLKNPAPVPDQTFTEEFDTAIAAKTRGWEFINTSNPLGPDIWQDGGGIPPIFNSYSNNGSNVGFIGVRKLSTSAAAGTISNWLVSPSVIMQNGDKIIFYTKAQYQFDHVSDTTDWGNRLQVRINTVSDDLNVGNGFYPGNYKMVLIDINPNYIVGSTTNPDPKAYPKGWTRFEATVAGLNGPVKSRFAFRYFVEGGGSNGLGSAVGIDKVTYQSVNH
ncbi:MAG: choice-of-anchor J domain-containing protein [Bacteroidetes bacterium]|nr:choice-of-anchor J domain-containing protein [Bacteroidota bacterium]